jgi:hypothetical protein
VKDFAIARLAREVADSPHSHCRFTTLGRVQNKQRPAGNREIVFHNSTSPRAFSFVTIGPKVPFTKRDPEA